MADLPDWYTQVSEVEAEAYKLRGGADASKSASPTALDVYLGTDTKKVWLCVVDGAWGFYLIPSTLFDANTILKADSDDTPEALSIAASRVIGRKSTGGIAALTGAEVLALLSGQAAAAFSMNSQKITSLAAPTASADAARKDEVDTVDAKLDDVSQSQPTRALDTIYQNSTKIRVVTVCVTLHYSTLEGVSAQVGSASPPATSVGLCVHDGRTGGAEDTDEQVNITFIVLPSYYYRVATVYGSPAKYKWTEWDLH